MVPLILAAVVAIMVLVVIKAISLPIALVAILLVVGFAAWRLDRARSPGAAAPYIDENRPDFYGRSSESKWEVPTAYIDHPTGAGESPGTGEDDRQPTR